MKKNVNNRVAFERRAFNQCLREMKIDKLFDNMCDADKALLKSRVRSSFRFQALVLNYLFTDIGKSFKMAFEDVVSTFMKGFEKGKK